MIRTSLQINDTQPHRLELIVQSENVTLYVDGKWHSSLRAEFPSSVSNISLESHLPRLGNTDFSYHARFPEKPQAGTIATSSYGLSTTRGIQQMESFNIAPAAVPGRYLALTGPFYIGGGPRDLLEGAHSSWRTRKASGFIGKNDYFIFRHNCFVRQN
ncbi:unnamed protein product [Protopolystoma xenopodis]|uniref:Uncharacterized protein n=1 Tax=Protopolystoma xenopodis TaxID=117903 RepID=A0A448X0T5_9PLAT|nr:unnamed protein product [Protopolystoma xenopodis]